ncbi:hypothetical protein SteCoe_39623 [Stentor coeruleus]|uniref:Uncharacterized protein n=1 Tax=Stentor coeruleus TaxID=5963 RepID=A0A1R2AKH9_9CILI|nr:hypothetical protein SteCoe_39623 [Stentor coeruleus]
MEKLKTLHADFLNTDHVPLIADLNIDWESNKEDQKKERFNINVNRLKNPETRKKYQNIISRYSEEITIVNSIKAICINIINIIIKSAKKTLGYLEDTRKKVGNLDKKQRNYLKRQD